MTFSIDNPRGVATTPLRKICLGKTLRRTRVNTRLPSFVSPKITVVYNAWNQNVKDVVNMKDPICLLATVRTLGGTAPLGLIFEDFVHFLENWSNFGHSILLIWSEMFQGTSKITVLLQATPLLWSYSEKCAKINIFHVLNHKSITTWISEIPVQ